MKKKFFFNLRFICFCYPHELLGITSVFIRMEFHAESAILSTYICRACTLMERQGEIINASKLCTFQQSVKNLNISDKKKLQRPVKVKEKLTNSQKDQVNAWNRVNPLTPKISLVILLTVSHTIHMKLVWRIWNWINK